MSRLSLKGNDLSTTVAINKPAVENQLLVTPGRSFACMHCLLAEGVCCLEQKRETKRDAPGRLGFQMYALPLPVCLGTNEVSEGCAGCGLCALSKNWLGCICPEAYMAARRATYTTIQKIMITYRCV
jgi:hypothetical protein